NMSKTLLPALLPGIWLFLSGIPSISRAESIKLLVQEFPPFTFTDLKTEEITGVLTDKVQEIMRRAHEAPSIRSTSLVRAMQATRNDDNTCMFGFRHTQERAPQFLWIGPLIAEDWVLFGRKSDTHNFKTPEEAKPYSIGSYKNSATGLEMAGLGYNMQFAREDQDNPRLLFNNRIDFWIAPEIHGMLIAQQQGYANDIKRIVKYKSIDMHMLCNLHMDKHRIELFNKLNRDIDSDGTMTKILHKYGIR
ncbi:MAG: ABC transporter substrate-binding protein, partial [Burkholderiales bacterium]|nr:ABC transporter substrate-binding protein [Burkholderiales bacterium]